MRNLLNSFCIVHIDMPGQGSNAEIYSNQKTYPTVVELVSGVKFILAHYGIPCFLGLGYGAGAFILSLLALGNPQLVTGLILVNANAETASWTDQAYIRAYASFMRTGGFNRGAQAYLRWYHCGRDEACPPNLLSRFDSRILNQNPTNLAAWMESYCRRPSLGLQKPASSLVISKQNFHCPVLLVVGQESPHLEETRRMFVHCDPQRVNILELPRCRAPLDECSAKVSLLLVRLCNRHGKNTVLLFETRVGIIFKTYLYSRLYMVYRWIWTYIIVFTLTNFSWSLMLCRLQVFDAMVLLIQGLGR